MIYRTIFPKIVNLIGKGKILVVYGPRQVGKTTLVKELISQSSHLNPLYFNCDEPDIRNALTNKTSTELKSFVGSSNLLVIDEAQRVENIGLTLKLLVDTFPYLNIVVTGSSSFELSNKIKEPLTGRAFEFMLFPLSVGEISQNYSKLELERLLPQMLITGTYPEPFTNLADAKMIVKRLAEDYLYKDALEYQNLKNAEKIRDLMQMLALQVGSEVSYTELSSNLGVDVKTVEKYINIMEKAFVIHKLTPFSRNLRSELNKKRKIYFWDCGIRNALINNFNDLNLRNDVGVLWENFIVSQMKILVSYNQKFVNSYFWRTWGKSEIDYIEEGEGQIKAYEIKWQKEKMRIPKLWLQNYPQSTYNLINRFNWLEYLIY